MSGRLSPFQVLKDFINVATGQTDAEFVPAVSGKKIVVKSVYMVCGATATNITFNSKGSGAGSAISALFANAANGGAVLGENNDGWFETNAGEGLSVTSSGSGSTTGIGINYVLVD